MDSQEEGRARGVIWRLGSLRIPHSSWDCWTVIYASSWLPDISGIWTADADLGILAQRLATDLGQGTLARYEALVLIAHSMGRARRAEITC
jgi:hypothetical protein